MRLLVIEDSPLDYEMLIATLALQGVTASARRVEDAHGLRGALRNDQWDLVISDHHLPGFSSGQALQIVQQMACALPFIIVSGVIGEEMAVDAMKRGAADYLIKGRLARLGAAASNAVATARARREKVQAQERLLESQEQLRNLSHRLQTLIDEERTSIAREIHDEIGGALTAVRFDLDGLHRHLEPAPLERLQRAQSVLAQATETTQRLMRNLRPPTLDAGLVSALESLVREFRQRTGIAIEFHANASQEPLNANASLTLYRTCQEALTNVAKHAVARNVTVDLHHGSDAVSLEII
ncbi:MAG: response regulator, partial [Ramlibacter sp.]|nr:response regulator [Ramlibacter sp.]